MTAAAVPRVRPQPLTTFVAPAARALRTLRPSWNSLAPDPFATAEWLALLGALVPPGEPIVYGARRGDALVAALPLALRDRTLRGLENDHTPRFDWIGERAALHPIFTRMLRDPRWDALELAHVPADSALATDLVDLARSAGLRTATWPTEWSPYFELAGFEERLGSKFRGNLRRRAKKLPDLEFERIARYDKVALDEGLELERAGWKGGLGTAIACDAALARFYHAVARCFGRSGGLSLNFLRARGKRIAFHFALENRRVYFLLKPGFDPEFSSFGPGQLLVFHAALDAARRGLSEFDFLGWDMPWKRDWTDRGRAHVGIALYRPNVRGRLRYAARHVLRPSAGTLWRALHKRFA